MAAFVRPAAAPVIAVGNRVIVLTPESAKRTAIQAAGTNDKLVLLTGIYLLLAALGAVDRRAGAAAACAYGLLGVAPWSAPSASTAP